MKDGKRSPTPFLDISDRITSGGERGLLGLAFHPDYPTDPRVFVDYTNDQGDTIIASFRVDPADPDRADPASELVLLTIKQPFANHNGGSVVVRATTACCTSGWATAGPGATPRATASGWTRSSGKILRLDVLGPGRDGGEAVRHPVGQPVRRRH